jgi:hypothetical protein
LDVWWIASIFVQYSDADEIAHVPINGLDFEAPIFDGDTSVMGLIRDDEANGEARPGEMQSLILKLSPPLTYEAAKRVLITAEKQRRIWDPKTRFYAYEELHPTSTQRGIAIVSTFNIDPSRIGTLTLVITPDEDNTRGGNVRIAGQFHLT